MDGLPFQPGNWFHDPTKDKFHRSQTLCYRNGSRRPTRPDVAAGGMTLPSNRLSEDELEELSYYKPTLTYGQTKQAPPQEFVPGHVAFDKKVLRFFAWLKQTVYESPAEHYRVRPVTLHYYLEDDSLEVVEPRVENCGIKQGIMVKRQQVPKDDVGNRWDWRDLNNGVNITAYGKVFHLYDCDTFTRNWLESEGIEINPVEDSPYDPFIEQRLERETIKKATTPSDFDKLRQFLEMDRKVLRFYCVWDNRDTMFGQMKKHVLHYYLADDKLEILEVRTINDGYDPFPVFMGKHRCPKNRNDIEENFPRVFMEITDDEVKEYFSPVDFGIGKTIVIYGRRFLIYDVDNFTKGFYWKNFGLTDFTPINVDIESPDPPKAEVPPYNYHGTLDDSMQNIRKAVANVPKRDFVKYMDNSGKVLRFEAKFDLPRKEEQCRKFIICFYLANDMISVFEPPIRNSGFAGGKYLDKCRIARPGSRPEAPTFYGPQDFYIGAIIDIFRKRFVIIGADYYVLKYIEDHAHQFPDVTLQTIRDEVGNMGCRDPCQPMPNGGPIKLQQTETPSELESMVNHVKEQLRKLAVTSSPEPHRLFLGIDVARTGYVTKENIREACIRQHLPCNEEVIDCLASQIGRDPEHITMDELRKFIHDE